MYTHPRAPLQTHKASPYLRTPPHLGTLTLPFTPTHQYAIHTAPYPRPATDTQLSRGTKAVGLEPAGAHTRRAAALSSLRGALLCEAGRALHRDLAHGAMLRLRAGNVLRKALGTKIGRAARKRDAIRSGIAVCTVPVCTCIVAVGALVLLILVAVKLLQVALRAVGGSR